MLLPYQKIMIGTKPTELAVILTDEKKSIIWVNDAFLTITGYSLFEVLGKKPGIILQGQNTSKETIELISKSLKKQLPVETQIINYRKSGEPYSCHLAIHPVFNDKKVLTNFIAFEMDESNKSPETEYSMLQIQKKYKASSLEPMDEVTLFRRLNTLIISKNLFLDPDLDIKLVAVGLKSNTKYLSQVVNNQFGNNFKHYINQFRIDKLKEVIKDPKNKGANLFDMAQQCGFKNKSTFHKVFREFTQTTPKEFLKQNKDK
jgi:PAS domain S-box-containing protein